MRLAAAVAASVALAACGGEASGPTAAGTTAVVTVTTPAPAPTVATTEAAPPPAPTTEVADIGAGTTEEEVPALRFAFDMQEAGQSARFAFPTAYEPSRGSTDESRVFYESPTCGTGSATFDVYTSQRPSVPDEVLGYIETQDDNDFGAVEGPVGEPTGMTGAGGEPGIVRSFATRGGTGVVTFAVIQGVDTTTFPTVQMGGDISSSCDADAIVAEHRSLVAGFTVPAAAGG